MQERASQSLLLASYEPLKLCEDEAMLRLVSSTISFLLKIASRRMKKAKIF